MTNTMIVVLLLIASVVFAAPPGDKSSEFIPILTQTQDGPNPDGSYSWSYETGNDIKANERGGGVSSINNKDEIVNSAQGSYSYTADDGTPIQLSYIADENGFQPKGVHLPVSPEIPPAILRGLEWIAEHPEEDKLKK